MKNNTSSLLPLAAFAFFGACLTGVFSLLVVLMTSIGFAGSLPLLYFQKLNVEVISVALPTIGMILFSFISLGLSRRQARTAQPVVLESAIDQSTSNEINDEVLLSEAA